METKSSLERAEAQAWAIKLQTSENLLASIREIVDQYLDGIIADDEAMRKIIVTVTK